MPSSLHDCTRLVRIVLRLAPSSVPNQSQFRRLCGVPHKRRNWLFAGSLSGGRAAAVVYILIECCRRANVDMVSYLADVLVRVATHPASRVEELLPANWTARFDPQAPELALA